MKEIGGMGPQQILDWLTAHITAVSLLWQFFCPLQEKGVKTSIIIPATEPSSQLPQLSPAQPLSTLAPLDSSTQAPTIDQTTHQPTPPPSSTVDQTICQPIPPQLTLDQESTPPMQGDVDLPPQLTLDQESTPLMQGDVDLQQSGDEEESGKVAKPHQGSPDWDEDQIMADANKGDSVQDKGVSQIYFSLYVMYILLICLF
jgi:hypothetical protein